MTRPGRGASDQSARRAWAAMLAIFLGGGHQDAFVAAADALGLTPGSLKSLLSLATGDGCPMRDLADDWRCDASHVTQVVDALEAAGFVERRPAPHDRRVRLVALTPAGEQAQAAATARLLEPPPAITGLPAAARRQLADLLEQAVGQADPASVKPIG